MPTVLFVLGIASLVMVVAIGLLVAKDVRDLIDLAGDPNLSTDGPRDV